MDRVEAPASPETSTSSQGMEGARWEGPAVPGLEEVHTEGQGVLEGAELGAHLGRRCCLRGGRVDCGSPAGRAGTRLAAEHARLGGLDLRLLRMWARVGAGQEKIPPRPFPDGGQSTPPNSAGPWVLGRPHCSIQAPCEGGAEGRGHQCTWLGREAEGSRCGPGEGAVERRLQHQCTWAPRRSRPASV